jgi:hypothetical protein
MGRAERLGRIDVVTAAADAEPSSSGLPAAPVFEVRPRKIRIYAWSIAIVLLIAHGTVGLLLTTGGYTGVHFRTVDKLSMLVIGLLLAGGVLLFTRPRLRIDADGVRVRNVLGESSFPWEVVRGFSFPDGAAWVHLELPDYEFVSVMAIQARDGASALDAVDKVRELAERYQG